ncbi:MULTISPECIES: PEGA domain-containing protein [Anaeromyxobacter]|uniref:PEGA domain-containing protein n=1 Tax=Anaeromyxobacter TaxID=161492 RepID=UPI001F59510E|nr:MULTISPECIES: PEGA domain-containing protein [unclassified Anaeromyxobacter]
MIRRLLAILLLLAVLAPPAAGRADEVADAKARFRKGAELYRARQYREAIAEFEEAYRLKPAGAIHYNVAQCRERLGEWPAAIRSYNDYLREAPDANDRAVVRAAVKKLEERLAATGAQPLIVYSDPPGAEVRIDGRVRGVTPFHLVLPPGSYDVALALAGHERLEQEIAMSAGAAQVVDVQLRPAQPPPPAAAKTVSPAEPAPPLAKTTPAPDLAARPEAARTAARRPSLGVGASAAAAQPREKRRIYTWIAAGTAVAAAATGGYFGWSARQAESAIDGMSQANGAVATGHVSDATSRAHRANTMFVVAGSAAAASVTLFFVEKKF